MEQFDTFESDLANLLRVYRARNETDLAKIGTIIETLLRYTRALEARIAALENRSPTGYVENRTHYLSLKPPNTGLK